MINGKIGVGIITCNRYHFLKKLVDSLPRHKFDYITIINDSISDKETEEDRKIESNIRQFIVSKNNLPATQKDKFKRGSYHRTGNLGVGTAKNWALKNLLEQECEHIFIIEDDLLIKDENVFDTYIETSQVSGLKHLMYGYHGPANKDPVTKTPKPRFKVPYNDNGISVAFNLHCVGAFCYYHNSVLQEVGLMDETFNNCWEHVDHSYQIIKAGYLPSFWNWPDVFNSYEYIDEQACSEDNSTIRCRKDWMKNIKEGANYYAQKNGMIPTQSPDLPKDKIYSLIKEIRTKYGKS